MSSFVSFNEINKPSICNLIFLNRIVGLESKLGPLDTLATYWPTEGAPGDCEDGEFGGIKIDRGNRSTRRKPAPAPLCPT
jgi:hypothetical protein